MEEIGMNETVKFENFKIEARECNNLTERTIYLENNHKYSFASCKRARKRKMQKKHSLETEDTDEYSESILSKSSNKYNYPGKVKNIKRKRNYFDTTHSASENGLNIQIQMMKNPTKRHSEEITKNDKLSVNQILGKYNYPIRTESTDTDMYDEFGNYSSFNQNSDECDYPVSMVNTTNAFQYSDSKLSTFENYLNIPIQMRNRPEIYYEKIGGKRNYSSLNHNSNEFGYPVIVVNTGNEYEYTNNKSSAFENDFDKFIEPNKNSIETVPEEIKKYGISNSTKISSKCNNPIIIGNTNEGFKYNYRCNENDLNEVIQMQRKSPKTCSDLAQDDCNGTSLNQISSECGYPVTMTNPTEEFEYFSYNYSKFENDLNAFVETQRKSSEICSDEAQEDFNDSILNQISGEYDYPVTTAYPNEKFEYFNNNYSKFKTDLNGPVETQRKSPEICSDEAQEDYDDSILNQISGEYGYPVTMANPAEEFEYFSNNYSKFENDLNGFNEMSNTPKQFLPEIEKDEELSLNPFFSKHNHPIKMKNANEEFKYYDSLCSRCKNKLNELHQMNPPATYFEKSEENINTRISDEYYHCRINPDERSKYFGTKCNEFKSDFNGQAEVSCPFQESNPADTEINVTINLKDAFSLAKNCIDSILLNRESLFDPKLCNLLDIGISENKVSYNNNQIRQKFSRKRIKKKFRKNKINYKATLENKQNRYLHPFVKERNLKNSQQSQDFTDANLKNKRNSYLYPFVKKKNLKNIHQSQKFANGTRKNSQNRYLRVFAKENNLMNIQQSQKDLRKTASEQKCSPGQSNFKVNSFESERPLFFVIDEWNESNLPLQGEEEIINFNSMFSEREDKFVAGRNVQKHFKRKTNASFTSLNEESNPNNKTDSVQFQNKDATNYVSTKQDSWQKSEWDSLSSTSSASEVDGKRSWKNFERSYFKKR